METIGKPITGKERLTTNHSVFHALVEFYQAFNARDLDAMSRSWAQTDDVVMDNPLGGIRRGWAASRAGYERLFTGPVEVYVEFYDYTLHETGDIFYAVGRERGYFRRDGRQTALAIRTSRIFHRLDGRWRQVHHHGSIEDPALLEHYQRAVLGEPA